MAKSKTDKTTKRSKIIVEIANGSKKLTDALFELKILLSDLGSLEVVSWIDSELKGYETDEKIPEYRKFDGVLYGNIEQSVLGSIVQRKMAIPIKVDRLDFRRRYLRENITEIENYAEEKEQGEIAIPVDIRIANQIAALKLNEFTQIVSAWFKIPPSTYTTIINAVRSKILDILIMLEKKYGNLDDYTINFGKEDERVEVSQMVVNIIHNDNSISIGDNNKISKSEIGENNEG